MSKKKQIIGKLLEIFKERKDVIFDNALVRDIAKGVGFSNSYDVDNTSLLPDSV